MKFSHRIILAWSLIWLPVSGVVAITMPFCPTGMAGMAGMKQAQAHGDDVADEAADQGHCQKKASDGSSGSPHCEHCDLCDIAGAMLPATLPPIHSGIHPEIPADLSRADFSSFYPEQLQRPPLLSPV